MYLVFLLAAVLAGALVFYAGCVSEQPSKIVSAASSTGDLKQMGLLDREIGKSLAA
jgi:outer membrane murein-binding lipoprotein Lpp